MLEIKLTDEFERWEQVDDRRRKCRASCSWIENGWLNYFSFWLRSWKVLTRICRLSRKTTWRSARKPKTNSKKSTERRSNRWEMKLWRSKIWKRRQSTRRKAKDKWEGVANTSNKWKFSFVRHRKLRTFSGGKFLNFVLLRKVFRRSPKKYWWSLTVRIPESFSNRFDEISTFFLFDRRKSLFFFRSIREKNFGFTVRICPNWTRSEENWRKSNSISTKRSET